MSRIQLRRDTAANWAADNPILAAGELAVELDTGLLKFGDGSTVWSGLAYLAAPGTGVASVDGSTGAVDLTGKYAQLANNLDDLADAAAARTNLGLGAAATKALTDFLRPSQNLSDLADAAAALVNLGAAKFRTPQQFGAKADGVTNDHDALQAWLDAGGGYMPEGTYLCNGNLVVDADNVTIRGAGWNTIISHTSTGWALQIGTKTSGVARSGIQVSDLRIEGTSIGSGGLWLIGVQFSRHFDNLRIDSYSGTGAIGWAFDTQSSGTFVASSGNASSGCYITGCTNGLRLTKDAADAGTDGCNFNSFTGLRVDNFSGVGVDNDAGEYNCWFALDSSSAINGATGLRINDDVCCFFGVRTDSAAGAGNTNVGIHITANGRDHLILNPTGNGPTTFIVRDTLDTPGVIVRQGWTGAAWVGDVLRSEASHGTYSSNFARTWDNIGTTAFIAGQIGFVNTGFAQGGLKRCDTVQRKWLFVALDAIAVGASGRFAEPGAVCPVLCDTGAVNVGDTLVQSLTTGGSATVNNTITDPSQVVGFARTSKTSGAAGTVEAYIR